MNHLEDIDTSGPDFGDLYDELPLWSAPFGLRLLDRVPMRRGATILDVGAGTGFLTIELAQRCGAESTVIAVDPWKIAVARLRRKVDHLGLANVRILEQDAAAMDLPDASVDVVVSNIGVNNFENAPAVLAACFRVAKRGARVLLTTNLVGHMLEFYDVYRNTLVELGQRNRLAVLEAHVAHRGTVESVSNRLRDAGFRVVDVFTDSFRMRFADGSALLRHHFVRLGFLPGWRAIPAAGSVEATFEALERNLNAVARQRGELALTIPMACLEASKP